MVRNWACYSVVVNIRDSFANRAFIEDRFLVNQAGHERSGADLIDATGNAFGVLEDALQGIIGEERTGLVPGDLCLMLEGSLISAESCARFTLAKERQPSQGCHAGSW